MLSLAGCGKGEPDPTLAGSGKIMRMAGGVDLGKVRNQAQIVPLFELAPPDASAPLLFGVVENEQHAAVAPVIVRKEREGWKIAELPELHGCSFVYVGACASRQELWAVLEEEGEQATKVWLLRSGDGGATWTHFSGLSKPTTEAFFVRMSLGAGGDGRITFRVTADRAEGRRHGYYHFVTKDGCKQWRGPIYEPDDLLTADSFDGGTLQEAIKGAEAFNGSGAATTPALPR